MGLGPVNEQAGQNVRAWRLGANMPGLGMRSGGCGCEMQGPRGAGGGCRRGSDVLAAACVIAHCGARGRAESRALFFRVGVFSDSVGVFASPLTSVFAFGFGFVGWGYLGEWEV